MLVQLQKSLIFAYYGSNKSKLKNVNNGVH